VDARHKPAIWREDYNCHRSHAALEGRTPEAFAAAWASMAALRVLELAPTHEKYACLHEVLT
jgi:hypothetical protein